MVECLTKDPGFKPLSTTKTTTSCTAPISIDSVRIDSTSPGLIFFEGKGKLCLNISADLLTCHYSQVIQYNNYLQSIYIELGIICNVVII
jgi:hypothetical protein